MKEGEENFLGDKTEDGREVRSGGSGSPLCGGGGCGDLGKVRNTPMSLQNFQSRGTCFLCWGIESGKHCKPLRKIFLFHLELARHGLTQFVTWTCRGNYIRSKRAIESISQVSLTLMGHEKSTKSSEPFKMDEAGS